MLISVIKDRIKICRNKLDLTLEDVAKIVGVTRATIQKYENGIISNIPSDKIELLAKALQTTPAYLMGWEQEQRKMTTEIPNELKGVSVAFNDGGFDGLDEDDIEILTKMARHLRAKKIKGEQNT